VPVPLNNYRNNLAMIIEVNDMINHINKLNSHDWVIGFSTEGCRSVTRGGERRTSHNFGAWREIIQGKPRCLLLNDRHRAIMLRKLIRFIETTIVQPNVNQPNELQPNMIE
jgi:hypothetical protein